MERMISSHAGLPLVFAVITLGLKVWPGALETLATGLYSHVRPERLSNEAVPYVDFAVASGVPHPDFVMVGVVGMPDAASFETP